MCWSQASRPPLPKLTVWRRVARVTSVPEAADKMGSRGYLRGVARCLTCLRTVAGQGQDDLIRKVSLDAWQLRPTEVA